MCIKAIEKDRSLLPEAIKELEEIVADGMLEDRIFGSMRDSENSKDESENTEKSPLRSASELSDDDLGDLHLGSISLDAGAYLHQFEPDDALDLALGDFDDA
jgi:hypothetical protein